MVLLLAVMREWDEIISFQWQVNWLSLLGVILFHSLALCTIFFAWHISLRHLSGYGSIALDFRIFSISMLARRIPLPIWYLGSRFHLYRKENVSIALIMTVTSVELALIAITGIVCFIIFLPWYNFSLPFPPEILGGIVLFALVLMIFRPNLFADLINFVLRMFKKPPVSSVLSRKMILGLVFLYLVAWILDGIGFYFLLRSFLFSPPPIISMIGIATITGLIGMASMVFPAGFGLKELSMSVLLSVWMPVSAGLVISILNRLVQTMIEFFWAAIGQKIPIARKNKHNTP